MGYQIKTFDDIDVAKQFQKSYKKVHGQEPQIYVYSEDEIKVVIPKLK